MTAQATEIDSAPAHRRRGAELEHAILESVGAELAEVGYTALTVERVAARSHTGKASIYRRWPTKAELVMDALDVLLPSAQDCGAGTEVPDDVGTVEALHGVARAIAGIMSSPSGDAIRAVKCEAAADPELAALVDARFQAPRRAAMIGLLRRGIARGEVRPGADCALVADVLPAVLFHRVVLQREPVSDELLTRIVDQVLAPLVEAR